MALQVINVGATPNDGQGDAIRTAYIKCNDNFGELYSRSQTSPPVSLEGSIGDQAGMYAYSESFWYYCYADYDGSSTIWAQVAQIGNISVSAIQSGNSSVQFSDVNGNVIFSVRGTSNVASVRQDGFVTSSNVTATNVNATNLYGAIATAAQPNITSVGTLTALGLSGALTSSANVSTTGNVIGGNLIGSTGVFSSGNVSATGNILGGNIIGATSIKTPGIISATGNIVTDGYFVGTFFGNITGNLTIPGGNTQVIFNTAGNADASANFTFNKATNVLQVTGNISTGNVLSTVTSASGNVTGGNLVTGGLVTATGNVTSVANITGGNLLTSGIVSASSVLGSVVSASGNITGGNVIGGGISAVSNITGANLNVTTASVTGNFTTGNANISGTTTSSSKTTGALIVGGGLGVAGTAYNNRAVTQGAYGNVILSEFTGIYNQKDSGTALIQTTTNALAAGVGMLTTGGSDNSTQLFSTGNLTIKIGVTTRSEDVPTGGTIVASVTSTGLSVNGLASASGNITGGNLVTSGIVSAASHIGSIVSVTGNVTGGNVLTNGIVSAASHIGSIVSVTGNVNGGNLISAGTITVAGNIVSSGSNGVSNIGSATTYFNTVHAMATSAQYADLAEKYIADANYVPGTVIVIGGNKEVTASTVDQDRSVVGVVSSAPAYIMNSGLESDTVVTVALVGRVPCLVQGPIARGSLLVSTTNGRARAEENPKIGSVIGKALENFDGDQGTIEIIVGKL